MWKGVRTEILGSSTLGQKPARSRKSGLTNAEKSCTRHFAEGCETVKLSDLLANTVCRVLDTIPTQFANFSTMTSTFSFQAYVYSPERGAFSVSMESFAEQLQHLQGLFFEWDGSFTWANQKQGWQIDGTVYDNGDTIQYVDLHGRGSSDEGRIQLIQRLKALFAGLEPNDSVSLMRLPEREWQDLQAFEKEVHPKAVG